MFSDANTARVAVSTRYPRLRRNPVATDGYTERIAPNNRADERDHRDWQCFDTVRHVSPGIGEQEECTISRYGRSEALAKKMGKKPNATFSLTSDPIVSYPNDSTRVVC